MVTVSKLFFFYVDPALCGVYDVLFVLIDGSVELWKSSESCLESFHVRLILLWNITLTTKRIFNGSLIRPIREAPSPARRCAKWPKSSAAG